MLKPARTDPVGALFVFLDLLERQPESLRKFSLAHAKHQPPHAGPFHHGAGVEIIAPASAQNAPAMTLPSPAADFAPFRSP
jgi:hypothetical protein